MIQNQIETDQETLIDILNEDTIDERLDVLNQDHVLYDDEESHVIFGDMKKRRLEIGMGCGLLGCDFYNRQTKITKNIASLLES